MKQLGDDLAKMTPKYPELRDFNAKEHVKLSPDESQGYPWRIVCWIEETLEGRFRLTINREKTRVVKMHQPGASLNFLGFTFRYEQDLFGRNRRYLRMEPSRKAEERLREKVREQTGPQWSWMPLPSMIGRLHQMLRGWCAYFRHGHPHRAFYRLDGYLLDKLRRHLRRRSQRRYRTLPNESLNAHLQRHGLQFFTDLEHPANASRRKVLGQAGCGKSARPV